MEYNSRGNINIRSRLKYKRAFGKKMNKMNKRSCCMINLNKREASKIVVKLRDGRLAGVQYKEVESEGRARKHFVTAATIENGGDDGIAYLKNYSDDLKHNSKDKYDIMAYAKFDSQQAALNFVLNGCEPDWDWKRNKNAKIIEAMKTFIDALEEDED